MCTHVVYPRTEALALAIFWLMFVFCSQSQIGRNFRSGDGHQSTHLAMPQDKEVLAQRRSLVQAKRDDAKRLAMPCLATFADASFQAIQLQVSYRAFLTSSKHLFFSDSNISLLTYLTACTQEQKKHTNTKIARENW